MDPKKLPIYEFAEKSNLLDIIDSHKVVILAGHTGSGKSSQLPQMLLERSGGSAKILCAQPRRLATIGTAQRVAHERNVVCGGLDVGYHIGQQQNAYELDTKIIFCTTGILLEKLKTSGSRIFSRSYIIIDEVHERGTETDLVLSMLFILLNRGKSRGVRLILMSATADVEKYTDYFKRITKNDPEFAVTYLEIENFPNNPYNFAKEECFLELCCKLAGYSLQEMEELMKSFKWEDKARRESRIEAKEYHLLCQCIRNLYTGDTIIDKDILVFLPTFGAIAQAYHELSQEYFIGETVDIVPLHSSLDVENTLTKILQEKARFNIISNSEAESSSENNEQTHVGEPKVSKPRRKIYLATNIAESSVTFPDIAYVFDFCRTNQVEWNEDLETNCPRVVFESKSNAIQRAGRTGRTCDGKVYRMVPKLWLDEFDEFEQPHILRSSLREEILLLSGCKTPMFANPLIILENTMDAPNANRGSKALDYIRSIQALQKKIDDKRSIPNRSIEGSFKFEQTLWGRCLNAMPMGIDMGLMTLNFACEGILREGAALAHIVKSSNTPVKKPFPDDRSRHYRQRLSSFSPIPGSPSSVALCQLSGYASWVSEYLNVKRVKKIFQVLKSNGISNSIATSTESKQDLSEEARFLMTFYEDDVNDWCEERDLSFNALHGCQESILGTVSSLLNVILHSVCTPVSRIRRSTIQENKQFESTEFYNNPAIGLLRANCKPLGTWYTPMDESIFCSIEDSTSEYADGSQMSVVSNAANSAISTCERSFRTRSHKEEKAIRAQRDLANRIDVAKHILTYDSQSRRQESFVFRDYSRRYNAYDALKSSKYFRLGGFCDLDHWKNSPFSLSSKAFKEFTNNESNILSPSHEESLSLIYNSTTVTVICTDAGIPLQVGHYLAQKETNHKCAFRCQVIPHLTRKNIATGHLEQLGIDYAVGTTDDFFFGRNFEIEQSHRVWWNISEVLPSKRDVYIFFAYIVGKLFEDAIEKPNIDWKQIDVIVILTLDERVFEASTLLSAAWNTFFELFDIRPYNLSSRLPDSVSNNSKIDLYLKFDNSLDYNALLEAVL